MGYYTPPDDKKFILERVHFSGGTKKIQVCISGKPIIEIVNLTGKEITGSFEIKGGYETAPTKRKRRKK